MMNIKFGSNEKKFKAMQDTFNEMADEYYPDILEFNHYELWAHSGKKFTPFDWKEFRLEQRVDDWYSSELYVIVQNRATQLLRTAGKNKSVGESQALTQVMNFLDKNKKTAKQETKFIYSFVPLNIQEEGAENVKILENVPVEIADAITSISRNKSKE